MPIQETLDSLLAQAGKHFTVAFEPLAVDDEPLQVLNVTDMQSRIDAMLAARTIHNPLKDLPLWAKVWPASFVLGRFLRTLNPAGKSLLEVGAGCGVTGCLAARYGFAHVTVSDIVTDALVFAKANVLRNGLQDRMDVRYLDVSTTRLEQRFDCIAASEILYLEELHRPLIKFIGRHLAAGGKAVFCTDWARRKPQFVKLAAKEFTVTEHRVGVRSTDEDGQEQGRLYTLHILERA